MVRAIAKLSKSTPMLSIKTLNSSLFTGLCKPIESLLGQKIRRWSFHQIATFLDILVISRASNSQNKYERLLADKPRENVERSFRRSGACFSYRRTSLRGVSESNAEFSGANGPVYRYGTQADRLIYSRGWSSVYLGY